MIELPIQRLRDDAVVPKRAYAGDAGLDLSACDRVELGPGERALVGTGLAVAIPTGYAGYVQPRSGLAIKHGISMVNTPGVANFSGFASGAGDLPPEFFTFEAAFSTLAA